MKNAFSIKVEDLKGGNRKFPRIEDRDTLKYVRRGARRGIGNKRGGDEDWKRLDCFYLLGE